MQIEFTPQIRNLIAPDKSKMYTEYLCWAPCVAVSSLPHHTLTSTAHICFSLPEIQTQSNQKRDFILRSFQSALTSVGKADLRRLCHQYSNRLFLHTQPVCWSATGVVHFVFWQPAVKQNPQTKLEKATRKVHFIPLSSSKMSNNKNHLWPFQLNSS